MKSFCRYLYLTDFHWNDEGVRLDFLVLASDRVERALGEDLVTDGAERFPSFDLVGVGLSLIRVDLRVASDTDASRDFLRLTTFLIGVSTSSSPSSDSGSHYS